MASYEPSLGSAMLGGPMSRRQLHFIWILDCSGSMNAEGKIQALNQALLQALPLLRDAAMANVTADVLVRVITFSDGAQWHVAKPTPVDEFQPQPIVAKGLTDMGEALRKVADVLTTPPMPDRALAPVLVLVSDGQPTDDFDAGLADLLATTWGARSTRLAVAIGYDANTDVLQKFIGSQSGLKPVQANNPQAIVEAIRWATTAVNTAGGPPQPEVIVF